MEFASRSTGIQPIFGMLDRDEIYVRAVQRLTSENGLHAGWVARSSRDGVLIKYCIGNRTNRYRDMFLRSGQGLGGKVHASGKLDYVDDYLVSSQISHEYDSAIACEDVHRMVAVPIRAGHHRFGVLFGGFRDAGSIGSSLLQVFEDTAQECAEALYFAERVGAAVEVAVCEDRRRTAKLLEMQLQPALRVIADSVRCASPLCSDNDALMRRLHQIEKSAEYVAAFLEDSIERSERIAEDNARADRPSKTTSITPREQALLVRIAIGETNSEIADGMHLSVNTVKSYLSNVMSKLRARNRIQAVIRAKELGLL